ncbi:Charged multivesicular body protein 3 [Smittium mucronatum]|uniref:Charged multivesicular body protein 3 n=1 Tax=Smittium mucronatum TaxID=133383 RepID=A0A1R0H3E9_9FUNG|nr:Charged multivesicular body protein 3 [Smittium mucronatum]
MWNLFAKPPTPEELVRKWKSGIRAQERQLDRQVRNIEIEEQKTKKTIAELAKKKDLKSCRILAKEIVRSDKQKNRIIASKAQLNSISMELQRQLAMKKVAGTLHKSTVVMKTVNSLVKVPEIQRSMMEMSREMMKAGIIEEMTMDVIDALDEEDLEDEVDQQVEQVLFEVTKGILGKAGSVNSNPALVNNPIPDELEDEEDDSVLDLDEMRNRLSALKG